MSIRRSGTPRRHGQYRLLAIQGLDLRLLIHAIAGPLFRRQEDRSNGHNLMIAGILFRSVMTNWSGLKTLMRNS